MNLKTFCLFFFLISFLAFSPEVKAYEGTSSDDALSPSTIFYPGSIEPRSNIGKMLKNNGFKLQSVKEEKDGFTLWEDGIYTDFPSYVKIFTKGGYTIRYRYAIINNKYYKDEVSFDAVEIKFPSKSAKNKFLDSLKVSIKRKGFKIFTYPDIPNILYIGGDEDYYEDYYKDGILWPFDKIIIKGNNVLFYETKGMSPHNLFMKEMITEYL